MPPRSTGLLTATGSRLGGRCSRCRARAFPVDTRDQYALVAAPFFGHCRAIGRHAGGRYPRGAVVPTSLAAAWEGAGHESHAREEYEMHVSLHVYEC